MDNGGIKALEIFMHDSFVDYDLLDWGQISNGIRRIIEFNCLHELLLLGSVTFIRFEEGSASSSCLHDFHRQVLDVVIVNLFIVGVSILKIVVTSNVDIAFCTIFNLFSIFFSIVFSREIKESCRWFFFK